MTTKKRFLEQFKRTRYKSKELLKAFTEPAHWVHRVQDASSHALWFCGHVAVVDNWAISMMDESRVQSRKGYGKLFGPGSRVTTNLDDYPPVDEVREYWRDRRKALLAFLDTLGEADFDKPTPQGSPDFVPDFGSVFHTMIFHEGFHLGQVSLIRRSLGHAPTI